MAFGRVVRTTAFKLSAIYFVVFTAFALVFVVSISKTTDRLIGDQVRETLDAEIRGLAEQGRLGGLPAVIRTVDQRSRAPGASLYVVTDAEGDVITGNVTAIAPALMERVGLDPVAINYQRMADVASVNTALVQVLQLPGGYRMLVGRDISETQKFRDIVERSLFSIVVLMIGLALVSWFFVSRRVLKRIDSVAATSRRIMEGDLSGRLEITGTGDEFDRLAASLNAMLDRIEALLYGLKDVTDNVAHDLKTPLTRLRNRVESALAGPERSDAYRAALEATIEESDHLIRTFNALLMIARIEAGSPDGSRAPVDLAEVAADVVDLYEPLAEEAGVALSVEAEGAVTVEGVRELIGQALANLVDNAIKYAAGEEGDLRTPAARIHVRREGDLAVVTVADNGPGVPEADRARVLQRFVRLEKSRSQPGSGLGLSLVAAVARLHDGSITLDDAGPGLAVTLRLPAR
ncbi:sensor histidine kinase [Prosthecomicrobium pneumaticum]|uniref:histidine kinase n=1 Tax=Prosthecomicrobium pneumaticum TaxID=81895 RepID=A0A7W9FP95_9HYPH|nr:ATP-binding protein [Prosthecomicrobium pneumaticum]MBB5754390.1 signal transduction histidine kinase [Prosthecomicrobium pneumaticum]